MSGHSKWSTIKHKKGAADAARGKLFTKHAKLISIAAKNGDDPEINSTLKTAIANAKIDNVPNDNISRAIKRGSGTDKDSAVYQELEYEGYAQAGVAIIIEALSDNINRAYTNIRATVEKNGGNLGSKGSVSYMFKDKGYMELIINTKNKEEIEIDIIESGAEDLEIGEDRVFITTSFEDIGRVRDYLRRKGYKIENVKKQKVPDNYISINDDQIARKFLNLIEKLEEEEDVSEIYHNADISDEVMGKL